MKILLIKLSSLGDLIHVFPALSDAQQNFPDLQVDWLVEEPFKEVPTWHPAVSEVIPLGLRRIKKQGWWRLKSLTEIFDLIKRLRRGRYDVIIDAQGLYKSAVLALFAKGKRVGLAKGASRENVAWLYQQSFFISWDLHAITRLRELFAKTFNYHYDPKNLDFKLKPWQGQKAGNLVFIHATTWPTKHYPQEYWQTLARLATDEGWQVELPQVNAKEAHRAQEISTGLAKATVLPSMGLTQIRDYLQKARAFIAVDTGLAHIAAAMGVPGLTLYGPTDPQNIGTEGQNQVHLAAKFECAPCWQVACTHKDRDKKPSPPCFQMLPPELVWQNFKVLLARTEL